MRLPSRFAMESDLVGMRTIAEQLGDRMTPYLRDFLFKNWTVEDFTTANMVRKAVCNKMWKLMRTYDLLLTPTLSFTFPMNLTRQPAAKHSRWMDSRWTSCRSTNHWSSSR